MRTEFIGRDNELKLLKKLKNKQTASLVIIQGRRRIGKSRLVLEFSNSFDEFYEFQGLAPRKNIGKKEQLKNFAETLKKNFGGSFRLNNWTEAFNLLASLTRTGKILLLLDEISWMSKGDADFAGKLKIAWDTLFSRNPNLTLVLCGSVSSWIQENILESSGFVGRISLQIALQELSLKESANFWKNKKISNQEKLKALSVTGGVPKYLEEYNFNQSFEKNIKELLFNKSGFLFNEFEHIFADIFGKKTENFFKIISALKNTKLTAQQISNKSKIPQNSYLSKYLSELELSGFLFRDFTWNFNNQNSSLSRYRISDNYLRFYLNYIIPVKKKIESSRFRVDSVEQLRNWRSILGLSFENLILNNRFLVAEKIGIPATEVINIGPFFQTKRKDRESCQIDLLIQTKFNTLYICEIKSGEKSDNVTQEIEKKIAKLQVPKNFSFRPVLIYSGEMEKQASYFDSVLTGSMLLS